MCFDEVPILEPTHALHICKHWNDYVCSHLWTYDTLCSSLNILMCSFRAPIRESTRHLGHIQTCKGLCEFPFVNVRHTTHISKHLNVISRSSHSWTHNTLSTVKHSNVYVGSRSRTYNTLRTYLICKWFFVEFPFVNPQHA